MSTLDNIGAIARREYTVRVRTRSFLIGTALLVVAVAVIAFLPVIVRYIDTNDSQKVAVHVGTTAVATHPVSTLTSLLNPATSANGSPNTASPDFIVSLVPDLDAARRAVGNGEYMAVLGITRASDGDLAFTLFTNDIATGRTAQVVRQASNALAIADRLARVGVAPTDQARLFAPAAFGVRWPDPARTEPTSDTMTMVGQDMLAFGMTVLIFMMIVMYGTWIAMSVVEEKSSRVMEVVLNAVTPFQLLTGKVFGVGAVAITQYGAIIAAGGLALLLQGPVASVFLGETATATPRQQGLTPELLLLFGMYGVLGFLMYAVLYAAAGSLISRQEDVNAIVMPLTMVSTCGYLIGIYAATGMLDAGAGWMRVLAQVPFLSPFMMLGRVTTGIAAPGEVVLSVALLVVSIGGALWLAARVYAAGVLLYGQRPGVRAVLRLVRNGM
jgi:ABC-2 type transport system permease protein